MSLSTNATVGSSTPHTRRMGGGGLAPRKIWQYAKQRAAARIPPNCEEKHQQMVEMKRIWLIPPGVWARRPQGVKREGSGFGKASDSDHDTGSEDGKTSDSDYDTESEDSEDDGETEDEGDAENQVDEDDEPEKEV
ncbi:hypothetical protein DFP72DRAFT_1073848 [Ephemerocybe angulata]|uniref:Uncharacterized protein n=1 Tax=Ephemerocybe angulata TaxID=980116 RepID=A0A8H6M1E9_9AGAR|nr:hypothetical protein DFP72DRAFT_1073848 [Tulosesus angulatus]